MYEAKDCAPFRLLAVIPRERTLLQMSWDGRDPRHAAHSWRTRHWYSSSASDSAQELRGGVCSRASKDTHAGSIAWLRQLHQSHENGPGAFSMCVHRELVETLSYTEVSCTRDKVSMLHAVGRPCTPRETHIIEMRRVYSDIFTATMTMQQRIQESDVCRG
jgi:hypothetical protein